MALKIYDLTEAWDCLTEKTYTGSSVWLIPVRFFLRTAAALISDAYNNLHGFNQNPHKKVVLIKPTNG